MAEVLCERLERAEAAGRIMPLTSTNLGYVLSHIYEFHPGAVIYFATVEKYKPDTPCIVAVPDPGPYYEAEEASLHQECLSRGFKNWLNVAVVSDTCDTAPDQTEAALMEVFNADCRQGGYLSRMMNYRKSG
jgi:hypothetical protein